MGGIARFEDLIAWQKARVLRREIYVLTRGASFRYDLGLADQMRRSARSIMANVAEGFDKHNRPDFHRFVLIAKGSCVELWSDLYALLDNCVVDANKFERLYALCDEQSRILAGLCTLLRRPRGRDPK